MNLRSFTSTSFGVRASSASGAKPPIDRFNDCWAEAADGAAKPITRAAANVAQAFGPTENSRRIENAPLTGLRYDPPTLRQARGRPEQRRRATGSGSSRATSRDERPPAGFLTADISGPRLGK